MFSDKELSGYSSEAIGESSFDARDVDVLESVDAVMDIADVLKTWLSLRGTLFTTTPQSFVAERSIAREISQQRSAALATPDVHVAPWRDADFTFSALQRRNSSVERY